MRIKSEENGAERGGKMCVYIWIVAFRHANRYISYLWTLISRLCLISFSLLFFTKFNFFFFFVDISVEKVDKTF